jgi:hypothetical protein
MFPVCRQSNETEWEVQLSWRPTEVNRLTSRPDLDSFYDSFAPQYRYKADRVVRPGIETNGNPPPSSLLTWWALLYIFSMLARYEPRRWAAILDIDESPYAAQLEFALSEAIDTIPQLVLEALDNRPILLNRPMSL